jgi:hypothetical protein
MRADQGEKLTDSREFLGPESTGVCPTDRIWRIEEPQTRTSFVKDEGFLHRFNHLLKPRFYRVCQIVKGEKEKASEGKLESDFKR